MTTLVELRNVTKSYRTEHVETQALRGIDLVINAGDYIAITGRSGCGKSTLLNALGLLDPVSSGSHTFHGDDALQLTFDERATLRNKHIGFVFQSFNLLDELSVLENVRLPNKYSTSPAGGLAAAEELLEKVGLGHRRHHRPSQLSGGQQQRVAIARALVMNPSILLLDEPTGNLDEQTSREVMDLLDEINDKRTAIVLVTHESDFASRAQRTLRLSDGRFECDASFQA